MAACTDVKVAIDATSSITATDATGCRLGAALKQPTTGNINTVTPSGFGVELTAILHRQQARLECSFNRRRQSAYRAGRDFDLRPVPTSDYRERRRGWVI
jgi:hypothetical protein